MLRTNNWPENMEYLTCDNYNGSNTPQRSIDLKSFFVNVSEPATLGEFSLAKDNTPFNGFSTMKFDMEIMSLLVRGGNVYQRNVIGNWTAGFSSPVHISSYQSFEVHRPEKIYRVFVILVRKSFFFSLGNTKVDIWAISLFTISKRHSLFETVPLAEDIEVI